MRSHLVRPILAILAVAALAACESNKSANPLSPTVAGPIPGVNITAPKLLEPGNNFQMRADKQPVTLLIENAATNGVRPLTYVFEVARDVRFGSIVFSKSGVPPGAGGRTSVKLEPLPMGRTYYWRARAEDGANTGSFSAAAAFVLLEPASIDKPRPLSPVGGQSTGTTPALRFRNAARSGPVGPITYTLEVSRNSSFTAIVWNGRVGEQGGDTSVTTGPLPAPSSLFWRVRGSDGESQGPWSDTASFVTVTAPAGGGGGGGGGTPGSCASSDGNYIVRCIEAKYPTYLRAGVSLATRQANMRFLRDRVIEAGLCGGLDLGWNLKRGGPDISIDFITERVGGRVIGHDIALDYDNTRRVLRLYWGGGTYPFYARYTRSYSCR